MVVTHLALELRFQGQKLRGFSCKLTRSASGFLPENSWIIALQVLLPYLLSGLGMVAAGIVMDKVQANTGQMDEGQQQLRMVMSNLALIQVEPCCHPWSKPRLWASWQQLQQSCSVVLSRGKVDISQAAILCASSVTTAFIAALTLGLVVVAVIIGSRKVGINPDNVATPIAASLGDLITLYLLARISSMFFCHRDMWFLPPTVCGFFLLLIPAWIVIARRSPATRQVLQSGWYPVILAMSISSVGGLILDMTVSDPDYEGMAVFTPVINGAGGNLVAVQASRMSTFLHYWSAPGDLPLKLTGNCLDVFCSSAVNSKSARVLVILVVPSHLFFLYIVHLMQGGHTAMTPTFIISYLCAAVLQVANTTQIIIVFLSLWGH
ncbi:hypothetical protein fugu_005507 [Takifugu bimaculatus]|uniref:Solute carrier family 41 member n=1 Tax=Takifugu bimaculatus TaxID=433685 RepID=A0A4Z2BAN0_9TELE|nr:hypothetical protein fugu_005507 [Takifugu bimaculatus]